MSQKILDGFDGAKQAVGFVTSFLKKKQQPYWISSETSHAVHDSYWFQKVVECIRLSVTADIPSIERDVNDKPMKFTVQLFGTLTVWKTSFESLISLAQCH